MIKLNGVSQPISIEYKKVPPPVKLCLESKVSNCSLHWIFSVFSNVLEQVSNVTLREKNWIIFETASQEKTMSATWLEVCCRQAMKFVRH